MKITINQDCDECYECVEACQGDLLTEELIRKDYTLYSEECTYCESCMACCPLDAIMVTNPLIEEIICLR